MIIIYQWLTPSRTCKGGSGRDQFWGFAMVLFINYALDNFHDDSIAGMCQSPIKRATLVWAAHI